MNILKLAFSLAAISIYGPLSAQTSVADLQQDFALLKREVGQLRLQVEELATENAKLAKKLRSAQSTSATNDAIDARSNAVLAEATARDEAIKKEIIAQVKKDLTSMANDMNSAMEKLAKAIGSRPQAAVKTNFSDDYPQNGIRYVIKSGDTLGKIARQNNSKIKWIQDANRISDPRGLSVGAEIFIPQE